MRQLLPAEIYPTRVVASTTPNPFWWRAAQLTTRAGLSILCLFPLSDGDLTPSSAGSRAFTVLYTLVGIVLIFTQVSALMTIITQPCYDALTRWIERRFPNEGFDIDGNGQADYHVPPSAFVFYTSRLAGPLIALTIVQLVGAACFHAVEGWHFSTALYHCFITATTCGYGDVGIQTDSGMVLAFWHITTSVCVLGSFIGEFDSTRTERQAQLKRQALMLAKMEANVWQGIIQPGQETVDKFGFVYGMLVQLDLVQQSDVEVFVKMFERSDKAKTGRLQRSDMSDIARGYANRASKIEAYKRQSSVALRMSRGSVRCSKAPSRATAMGSTTSSTAFSNADPKQVQVKVMGALTQQSSVISIPENE